MKLGGARAKVSRLDRGKISAVDGQLERQVRQGPGLFEAAAAEAPADVLGVSTRAIFTSVRPRTRSGATSTGCEAAAVVTNRHATMEAAADKGRQSRYHRSDMPVGAEAMTNMTKRLSAGAILSLAACLMSGCGIPVGPPAAYGSGGSQAMPNPAQSLTGITIAQPLGGASPGANDRNGTPNP